MTIQEYLDSLGTTDPSFPRYSLASGGAELLLKCKEPECQEHKKPTLYINNRTGFFLCHRCGKKGRLKVNGQTLELAAPDEPAPKGRLDKEYVDALHATLGMPGFKAAKEYITQRGFTDETINLFKLGYSPSFNAISIPNLDSNGKAVSLKYRYLSEDSPMKYSQEALGGESQLPYGLWLLDKTNTEELYITEGELDCISLKQYLPNAQVIALPGKNSFPKSRQDDKAGILAYLKPYKRIYLIPDNEIRAKLDFHRHAEVLGANRCGIVELPKGFKDINEALSKGFTASEMQEVLQSSLTKKGDKYVAASQLVDRSLELLKQTKEQLAYKSGIVSLDTALNGIRPGELTILAGEAGAGKTTLATQVLYHLLSQNVTAVMGSFEMDIETAIVPRFLSLMLEKNIFVDREVAEEPFSKVILNSLFFVAPNIFELTVPEVEAYLKSLYEKEKLQHSPLCFCVIDNLSRFRPPRDLKPGEYLKWEEEQIASIKNWTRKMPNLHIFLLAHLNKSMDGGMTKSRIRGSAVIAAEADNIILLSQGQEDNTSNLVVDKVRSLSGRRGTKVVLNYDFNTTRLDEMEFDDEY